MSIHDYLASTGIKQVALAKRIGVPAVLVHQWAHNKRQIPADRVLSVSRATEWRVTPHQLRPDIYPNPTDGLPPVTEQQEAA
jgi:DNA-binding transcriptional regulator YdaS (Cro superfamily)